MNAYNANFAWLYRLQEILLNGKRLSPRGKPTLDQTGATMTVDMRSPVITIPQRKLSYQFMAAEAYWMLTGDDSVAGVAPWNKHIGQFSDDGERFFGAYGPKIVAQLPYIIDKLIADRDSRQAVLTIWRESPPASKDIPCTVAMVFRIEQDHLNLVVFMRSSDAWFGVPYDIFNFSMVAHLVCGHLNQQMPQQEVAVLPGALTLMMASSHLYEDNMGLRGIDAARDLLELGQEEFAKLILPTAFDVLPPIRTPRDMYANAGHLLAVLKQVRDSKPGDAARWWEVPRAA